jgi:hypothetical protein
MVLIMVFTPHSMRELRPFKIDRWKKVYYPPPKKLGIELKRESLGE